MRTLNSLTHFKRNVVLIYLNDFNINLPTLCIFMLAFIEIQFEHLYRFLETCQMILFLIYYITKILTSLPKFYSNINFKRMQNNTFLSCYFLKMKINKVAKRLLKEKMEKFVDLILLLDNHIVETTQIVKKIYKSLLSMFNLKQESDHMNINGEIIIHRVNVRNLVSRVWWQLRNWHYKTVFYFPLLYPVVKYWSS